MAAKEHGELLWTDMGFIKEEMDYFVDLIYTRRQMIIQGMSPYISR